MFRASGVSRRGFGQGVVMLTPTEKGWSQRVVSGGQDFQDTMKAEYVSNESVEDVLAWLRIDMRNVQLLESNAALWSDMDPAPVVRFLSE